MRGGGTRARGWKRDRVAGKTVCASARGRQLLRAAYSTVAEVKPAPP